MALSAAEIILCNEALSRIGGKTFTEGTQTTTPEGIHSALVYEQTRNALLRSHNWPFAIARLPLVSTWATATGYTTDQYVWSPWTKYAIATATAGVAEAGIFTITTTADLSTTFAAGTTFYVAGSTGTTNDGTYTVHSVSWTTPTLTIVPHEAVSGGTDDGNIMISSTNLLYKCAVANTSSAYFYNDLGQATPEWTVVTDRPSFGDRDYRYLVPADYLRNIEMSENEILIDDAIVQSGYVWTSSQEIDLEYIYKVTDTTLFDPLFNEVLILQTALKLIPAIAGTITSSFRQDLKEDLGIALAQAKLAGYQETPEIGSSNFNNSRG